jgi:predicted lipid carrier protein YhbT
MPLPLQPLLTALRLIPDAIHTEILARLFSHLLRGQSLAERLGELQDRRLCIHITDAATRLAFRVDGTRLRATGSAGPDGPGDVVIRGTLADFWLLATRREDPDTLFFNRRLSIEGDTETGLYVKNLLDSLEFDWQAHVRAVLARPLADRVIPLIQRSGLAARLPHADGA